MGFMINGISSIPPKVMVVFSLFGCNFKGKDEEDGLKGRKGLVD